MELEELRRLPAADQQVFLLGRIAAETTSMEAALRFLHAALRGLRSLDAYLDAPTYVSSIIRECQTLAREHAELDAESQTAIRATLRSTKDAYALRNRFTHDLLREDLLDRSWELARLTRQPEGAPDLSGTSFDDMVALVLNLIAAKYRLRGSAIFVLQGTWRGLAFGSVQGEWDGSVTYDR